MKNRRRYEGERHLALSCHALQRMGGSLEPYAVGDILHYRRCIEVPQGPQDTTAKFCFWNPLINRNMVSVVSPDLCVVTTYVDESRLEDKQTAQSMVSLVTKPRYLPEFDTPLSRKFDVSVLAQYETSIYQRIPTIYVASRTVKSNNNPDLRRVLINNGIGGVVRSICESELHGLIPIGLYVEGVKIPLSAVLRQKLCRKRKPVPHWSFRPE